MVKSKGTVVNLEEVFNHYFTDLGNKFLFLFSLVDSFLVVDVSLNNKIILNKKGILFKGENSNILGTDKGFGIDVSDLNQNMIKYFDENDEIVLRKI